MDQFSTQWESKDGFKDMSSEGQSPPIMFIGCSDSRVPPEQILGIKEPGKVFVLRNVANQVVGDPSALAAIQYAVDALQVKEIVICGHTCCGGVRACLDGKTKLHPLIETWLCPLRNHLDGVFMEGDDVHKRTEREYIEQNVLKQVRYLDTLHPTVKISGYVYELETGKMVKIN